MPARLSTTGRRLTTAYCVFLGLSSQVAGFVVQTRGATAAKPGLAVAEAVQYTTEMAESAATSYPRGKKPAREMENPRPKLWIYDHCPYCIRPRMVVGLKGIPLDLTYLSNDDIETPTAMVGKKAVPILEIGRPGSEDHEVMLESLDIVRRLDEDPAFGPSQLAPASDRKDLDAWVQSNAELMRRLVRPRHVAAPLPEFQTRSAREAFIRNHPLPEPHTSYNDNLKNSPALIEQLERALWKLEPMIHSADCVSPPGSAAAATGKLSYDDIAFFPRMRALTIVRRLGIPPKLRAYLDAVSERCDLPLHDKIAS